MDRPEAVVAKRDAAWKSGSLARVVRSFCFECMGGMLAEVAECTAPKCPLYPFRLRRSAAAAFNEVCRANGWTEPRAIRVGNTDALQAYLASVEDDEGEDTDEEENDND